MPMTSVNPATGETIQTYPTLDAAGVERALALAASTFEMFSPRARLGERTAWLGKAAEILEADKARFAQMITVEMGKPIAQAEAEIQKCADACRYYAANAERILADEHVETGKPESYVRWLPLGPILAVMPWNFPFWQVFRFAAPALAAGNVGLLKHASNVPGCALAIQEVFDRAGFPAGAFQTLMIPASMVGAVIADDRVKAATLTGSEGAGSKVAEAAGRHLKKVVLELGGADPFIVMPSADIDAAVKTAVTARTQNAGQSCIAAKRFIVHADVYDAFLSKFVGAMKGLRTGDPMDRSVHVGPLATAQIRDDIATQVADSIKAGARCATGGDAPQGPGYFYTPTILTDIPESAPAYAEETFGPVASVFRISGVAEAIRLANATRFGLGSAVWTTDPADQAAFIDGIEAGFTAINGMTSSDQRLPFGGVKASGYGRELSDIGMKEFLNAKTVVRSA